MEKENLNSTETTKDKLPSNIRGLIESLSTHIPSLANAANVHSTKKTIPLSAIAATEISGISESSDDSSINSIGYIADTSELQQPTNIESPVKNPPNNQVTPLTPTTNLKMLVAAASSALDRERRESEEAKKGVMNEADDPSTSRKMKSLALLCKRFLQVADEEIGAGKEFSLEMMANSLGINRRRIYDIINVMEALEMISKQSKNWYLWHGRGNLLHTLAKLKAMVADDPDIGPYLDNSDPDKAKEKKPKYVDTSNDQAQPTNEPGCSEGVDEDDDQQCHNPADYPFAARSVRYDKSLGVLCQKFVMLFLISPDNEVTLEEAGRILVPDYQDDTIYMALNPPVNPKTKVRRLYDIANILTSLGLIEKKVFVGPLHIKKPGYSWSGPSVEEIESVWNSRKQNNTKSVRKGKKPGSSRPILHLDIPKETPSYCSPVKTLGGSRFKRSLSFGGTSTSTPRPVKACSTPPVSRQSTVLARPLCPKQVDYLREMREFENEMNKHAHRYPNVASVFHEFLQKYQSTLEQSAAANGRFILPKAVSVPVSTPPSLQDPYPQPQKHSDISSCSCGVWDGCVVTESGTNAPVGNSVPVMPTQSSVPQVPTSAQGLSDMSTGGTLATADPMSSNTFVASLANSILANILGTIQNTAVTEQVSSQPLLPSTQTAFTTVTSCPQDSNIANTPLSEIKNLQDNGTVGSFQKEGFVHVDELLMKPGSRVKPSNSTFILDTQRPTNIAQECESCSSTCTCMSGKVALNPSAFLSSNDFMIDKENVPNFKCNAYYHEVERSPKRQRVN